MPVLHSNHKIDTPPSLATPACSLSKFFPVPEPSHPISSSTIINFSTQGPTWKKPEIEGARIASMVTPSRTTVWATQWFEFDGYNFYQDLGIREYIQSPAFDLGVYSDGASSSTLMGKWKMKFFMCSFSPIFSEKTPRPRCSFRSGWSTRRPTIWRRSGAQMFAAPVLLFADYIGHGQL